MQIHDLDFRKKSSMPRAETKPDVFSRDKLKDVLRRLSEPQRELTHAELQDLEAAARNPKPLPKMPIIGR